MERAFDIEVRSPNQVSGTGSIGPPVVVADIDASTPEVLQLLGDNLRGVGEMYWIRNGRVVASIADMTDGNDLEDSISANNLILSKTDETDPMPATSPHSLFCQYL